MTVVYFNDKAIIREIGQELEHNVLAAGAECGLAYLKVILSDSLFSKSPVFLREISRLKSVNELLSLIDEEEADIIKRQLKGIRAKS